MLYDLTRENKTDEQIGFELKQVELTEQLTVRAMNSLARFAQGAQTVEQIYILEAKSALLAPPTEESPALAAPDAAKQAEILGKADAYVRTVYGALPSLQAIRTTLRFQDNLNAISAASGVQGGAKDAAVSNGIMGDPANQYVRYIHSTQEKVSFQKGTEEPGAPDKSPQWGQNGMIVLEGPDPALGRTFADAHASGQLAFVRWENVNGKSAAVFSYSVDKKKAYFPVNICCFPTINQTGTARFYSSTLSSVSGLNGGGVKGDMRQSTEWHNYKSTVPYHGLIFINPESGIVVRLVTQAEFSTSDNVRQQDERIDYAPVRVDNRTLVLPVRTIVQSEVQPQGDSGVGGHATRRTYFTSEFKNYTLK
ncbi:MAG TPA: hypothetical protein VF392_11560 [Terracidiphilus sp.]